MDTILANNLDQCFTKIVKKNSQSVNHTLSKVAPFELLVEPMSHTLKAPLRSNITYMALNGKNALI